MRLSAGGQHGGKGFLELRVVDRFLEQLLMRGERDERVADLVGEMLGHRFDEAQVRSLDVQTLGALVLGDDPR